MNKPNHVEIASFPHSVRTLSLWEKFDVYANEYLGSENVDWWIDVGHQESRVVYTVHVDLEEKALQFVRRFE